MTQAPSNSETTAKLTPEFVAQALDLSHTGHSSSAFTCIVTDSRKIQPGCLFVALAGEKFDGHDFIDMAVEKGAAGILCHKPTAKAASVHLFQVPDSLEGFRRLAAAWRRQFSIPLIAVAGSVGKTTTKELLAAILKGKWPHVLKTQGSQNGYVGIPTTLLELNGSHGAAVIEVGIDEIGAMEKHMQLVEPTVAVLTAIGPEHLEKLQNIETVAHEEGIALTYVGQTGSPGRQVVIHMDDPWISSYSETLSNSARGVRIVRFSLQAETAQTFKPMTDFLVANLDSAGTSLHCSGLTLKNATFPLPLQGKHNASNLLAAIAVASALGLAEDEIRKGLATFKGADGRSELRALPGPMPVVCDYYNANPTSTEAGLELLTQIASGHTRWACLGDMLELGPDEEAFHRGLARKLKALNIENVLLFGNRMRWLHAELTAQGFQGSTAHYNSHAELAADLLRKAKAGDAILIKGSRGMKMEEVWKILEQRTNPQ